MTFIFIHYEIVEKRKKAFIDNRHHLQTAEKVNCHGGLTVQFLLCGGYLLAEANNWWLLLLFNV